MDPSNLDLVISRRKIVPQQCDSKERARTHEAPCGGYVEAVNKIGYG